MQLHTQIAFEGVEANSACARVTHPPSAAVTASVVPHQGAWKTTKRTFSPALPLKGDEAEFGFVGKGNPNACNGELTTAPAWSLRSAEACPTGLATVILRFLHAALLFMSGRKFVRQCTRLRQVPEIFRMFREAGGATYNNNNKTAAVVISALPPLRRYSLRKAPHIKYRSGKECVLCREMGQVYGACNLILLSITRSLICFNTLVDVMWLLFRLDGQLSISY